MGQFIGKSQRRKQSKIRKDVMAEVAKHLVLLLLILAVINAAPQRKDTHFNMVSGHAAAVKQAFRDKDKSNPKTNQTKPRISSRNNIQYNRREYCKRMEAIPRKTEILEIENQDDY